MNTKRVAVLVGIGLLCGAAAFAMEGQGSGRMDHGASGEGAARQASQAGIFKHEAVSEGIRAEFQVMSLASMNMKDPEGHTHHIMVKAFSGASDEPLKDIVGKVKVITPSQTDTVAVLKDYGGIFAANFTADTEGRYGIICLLKVNGKKPLYKFWYPHK